MINANLWGVSLRPLITLAVYVLLELALPLKELSFESTVVPLFWRIHRR
jgi:hypothetical protein